jgi:hypothetical protein
MVMEEGAIRDISDCFERPDLLRHNLYQIEVFALQMHQGLNGGEELLHWLRSQYPDSGDYTISAPTNIPISQLNHNTPKSFMALPMAAIDIGEPTFCSASYHPEIISMISTIVDMHTNWDMVREYLGQEKNDIKTINLQTLTQQLAQVTLINPEISVDIGYPNFDSSDPQLKRIILSMVNTVYRFINRLVCKEDRGRPNEIFGDVVGNIASRISMSSDVIYSCI